MEKILFQGMSEEERITMLKDNCDKLLDDHSYQKSLTKEQIQNAKNELAAATIALHDTQEEKKDVDKQYNEQIKDQKKVVESKVEALKNRTTLAVELCFQFVDRDEGTVGIYNKDGVLIEERKANMAELREQNLFKGTETKGKEVANG